MAAAEPHVDGDDVEEPAPGSVVLPEKGVLAKRWEQRGLIREHMREHKKLLSWPSSLTTAVASKVALKLNRHVIADLLSEWGKVSSEPKAPPIAWLKQEAAQGLASSS